MKIQKLKDADINKVIIVNNYPHCKEHGAMNKMTQDGIWRCVSTYAYVKGKDPRGPLKLKENNCNAGCQQ